MLDPVQIDAGCGIVILRFFVCILHTAPSGANIGVCAVRNAKGE